MRLSARLAPRIAALWAAAAGIVNIISALYPAVHWRLALLRDLLPVHLIRASQTATVLIGFALILLAAGLQRRRRRALLITAAALVASAILNLTKGLDVEEASVSLILLSFLVRYRGAFHIRSAPVSPHRVARRTAIFAALYYAYIVAGFAVLRHAIRPLPTPGQVLVEPIRLVIGQGWFTYAGAQAHWFERSILAIGCVALLYGIAQVLRPFIPHRAATPEEIAAVRTLVRRYGTDSLSYFALQDGRSYFFHDSGRSVLSYRLWRSVAIVGGDPVGDETYADDTVRQFVEFADANGLEPCFLGAAASSLARYRDCGFRTLKIGEEAVIDLPTFDRTGLKRKVRRAGRHIAECGIEAVAYRRADLPAHVLAQMEEISQQWVGERGGQERGFSMTLGRLPRAADDDCEVTVALEGDRVWGYLCFVPVYGSSAWSLDAMRRRHDAPNGLTEFLVISAAEGYRDRGFEAMSLNFATLSNTENDIDSRTIEGTRRFLFENLSSYYQLKSLYQFNDKFNPRWHSRYLAYRDVLTFPRLALAIVQSEDPVRPPSLFLFRR